MGLTCEQYDEFLALASDTTGMRERECGRYLEHATDLLFRQTPARRGAMKSEMRSPYGRSDYVVIGDLHSGVGDPEPHMIFWELKAPQCLLMEADDSIGRFRPTKDLIKAESQLLHYVHQAARDIDLMQRYRIPKPENVRAGGIIIGRKGRLASSDDQDSALHSFNIRKTQIYDKIGVEILTWDRILDVVRPV